MFKKNKLLQNFVTADFDFNNGQGLFNSKIIMVFVRRGIL